MKEIFDNFFIFVIRKNLKQGANALIRKNLKQGANALHYKHNFIIISRNLLRTVETKPVSFYKIGNLLYETKVIV